MHIHIECLNHTENCEEITTSLSLIFSSSLLSHLGNNIKEGDIRLVPGSYLWQGLVEIFLDGVWGIIDKYYYGTSYTDARVVCRQLGYNTYSKIFTLDKVSLMYMCGSFLFAWWVM